MVGGFEREVVLVDTGKKGTNHHNQSSGKCPFSYFASHREKPNLYFVPFSITLIVSVPVLRLTATLVPAITAAAKAIQGARIAILFTG